MSDTSYKYLPLVNICRVIAMVLFYISCLFARLTPTTNKNQQYLLLKNRCCIFYLPTTQLYLTRRITPYMDSITCHGESRMAKYTSRGNEVKKGQ